MSTVWVDLETTGLEPSIGSILEIAVVVTDDALNEIGEPFESIVSPLDGRGYEVMDDYVKKMHIKNGLIDRIYRCDRYGKPGHFTAEAQTRNPALVQSALLKWFEQHIPAEVGPHDTKAFLRNVSLAGSSVHFDKAWLKEHMPAFEELFSHRILDVSTLTMLAKAWAPEIHAKRPGLGPDGKPLPLHRALDDIRMSIETLRYYRASGFIGGVAA